MKTFRTVAFVGHPHHTVTKSSVFMVDLLKGAGCDVSCYYDDIHYKSPGNAKYENSVRELLLGDNYRNFETFVCFQTDSIGKILLSKGCDVTFVPMWDDAKFRQAAFWRDTPKARYISFSSSLHRVLCNNHCSSHYFQFFPKPEEVKSERKFDKKSVFFWLRRPNSIVNPSNIAKIFSDWELDEIFLHNVPDTKASGNQFLELGEISSKVSVSTWFEDRQDFLKTLGKANIYVSPREYEGIGMSFLEAMVRGQVVVGAARSTFTDYITHGINGLVTGFDDPLSKYNARELERMSQRALDSISDGYERWCKNEERLLDVCLNPYYRSGTGTESNSHYISIKTQLAETLGWK